MYRYTVLSLLLLTCASASLAQVTLPEGSKVRVRLEQQLSSATAEEGQPVQLAVTEDVRVADTPVIAQGSTCVGTITQAVPKRRMGRTGKLDFSIERCNAVDGAPVPLRYSAIKKEGGSHGARTGALTAGAAIVFWPAAPVFLLMKGKDVTVNKGIIIDVFTDQRFVLKPPPAPAAAAAAAPTPALAPASPPATAMAQVKITSEPDGAEIELNGAFVGSTPASLQLAAGQQNITVRKGALLWRRTVQIQAGSSITVNAVLTKQ